jgi:hypothetical protein
MKPAPALGVGGTDDADPALGAGDPAAEPYPSAEITFTVLRVMYALGWDRQDTLNDRGVPGMS